MLGKKIWVPSLYVEQRLPSPRSGTNIFLGWGQLGRAAAHLCMSPGSVVGRGQLGRAAVLFQCRAAHFLGPSSTSSPHEAGQRCGPGISCVTEMERDEMPPLRGGITQVRGFENNLEIEGLASFAVDQHNTKQNALLEFKRVVNAKEQVVACSMYYITLEATDGGKSKNLGAAMDQLQGGHGVQAH
ncbi:hypothetical protein Droror1_Dr00001668 [Drosera rotundifolia]